MLQETYEAKVNKHLVNVCCSILKVAKTKRKKKEKIQALKTKMKKNNYQHKGMGTKTKMRVFSNSCLLFGK